MKALIDFFSPNLTFIILTNIVLKIGKKSSKNPFWKQGFVSNINIFDRVFRL